MIWQRSSRANRVTLWPALPVALTLLFLPPLASVSPAVRAQETGLSEADLLEQELLLRNPAKAEAKPAGSPATAGLFVPAWFRPPVPWLKLDDRFEDFVTDDAIRKQVRSLERSLLNPLGGMAQELATGVQWERDAYGRLVRKMKVGGFEFSTSAYQPGFTGTERFSLFGGETEGYDYDAWLQGSGDDSGQPDD